MIRPSRGYDHVVVGLGALGSAAAYALARRGARVLGLEQFALGHHRGASHDHSRIIRRSYHTPGYVRLADETYQAWRDVERDSGERLVTVTGGLDLWPAGAAIPSGDYRTSLDACGVRNEWLDAQEAMRRWPPFRLDPDVEGCYQADGGIVPAARGTRVLQRLAARHGATLLDETAVTGIRETTTHVEVTAGDAAWGCERVLLCADAWTNELLAHVGARLPLAVTREQVTYFRPADLSGFAVGRFPVWIWMDDPSFYGFPVYGEAAVKAAQDVGGARVTARTRTFEPDPAALARVEGFLARHLPGALAPDPVTRTCLYTLTPDRDFVLGPLPGHERVLVALGAAHGFKFAPLLGRILAELATDGSTGSDVAAFSPARPILALDEPPVSYLV